MKRYPHFQQTRSRVIYGHTRRMLDATSACMRTFAAQVAEHYIALVAPDQRQVPFRQGVTLDDLCKADRHNTQIVSRYMDGTVKALPADLEDAWVLALPTPYRDECERDLARRRDNVAVRIPDGTEAGEVHCLGRLTGEFGQLVEALAPALADGRISETDLPHARRILNESDDLIAAVIALRRSVQQLLLPGTYS